MAEIPAFEAAELLRVPKSTLLRWVEQGVLPTLPGGGFDDTMLLDWASANGLNCDLNCGLNSDLSGGVNSGGKKLKQKNGKEGSILGQAVRRGGVYKVGGDTMEEVLNEALKQMDVGWNAYARREYFRALKTRKKQIATVITKGIALPHVSPCSDHDVKDSLVGVFFLRKKVDFGEGNMVKTMLMPICNSVSELLLLLKELAEFVLDDTVRGMLLSRVPPKSAELFRQINDISKRKYI